jgi:hypothetical protein
MSSANHSEHFISLMINKLFYRTNIPEFDCISQICRGTI